MTKQLKFGIANKISKIKIKFYVLIFLINNTYMKPNNIKTITKGQTFKLKRKFTQQEVLLFSNLCGDKNPIHYDEEYCKTTIFKKPIIFGMLGASLFSNLLGNNIEGSVYVSQTLKFLKPIFVEEEIEAIVKVEDLTKPKNFLLLSTQILKIENNEIATTGEAVIKFPLDNYIFKL